MEWTQDLSVGVQAIDDQHKELIKRVNMFFDSMNKATANQEVLKVLDFLGQYIKTHFRDEENLQRTVQYPCYPEHKKMHEDFILQVEQIRQDIDKNGFTVVTKSLVGATLTNWLITHIRKQDKRLGEFINL